MKPIVLLAWVSDHFSSSFVQHITWAGHCSRLPEQVLRHVGVELLAGVHPRSWHPIVLNRLLAAVSNLLLWRVRLGKESRVLASELMWGEEIIADNLSLDHCGSSCTSDIFILPWSSLGVRYSTELEEVVHLLAVLLVLVDSSIILAELGSTDLAISWDWPVRPVSLLIQPDHTYAIVHLTREDVLVSGRRQTQDSCCEATALPVLDVS